MKRNSKRRNLITSLLLVSMLVAATFSLRALAEEPGDDFTVTGTDGLKVTYLGSSLRMDTDDATEAYIRFGYQFKVPEGKSMADYNWSWEFTTNGQKLSEAAAPKTVAGSKYIPVEGAENTYESNVVITHVPARYYERTFEVRLVVKDTKGSLILEETAASETLRSATIQMTAEKTVGITTEGDQAYAYANKILQADTARPAKVDDQIFADLEEAVKYAGNKSGADNPKIVTVRKDMTIAKEITIPAGKNIVITAGNQDVKLTRDTNVRFFTVEKEGSLIFKGNEEKTIALDGNKQVVTSDRAMINNNGTFQLDPGASLENASSSAGGSALRNYSSATCILNGTVQNNETTSTGVIYNDAGTLTIENGTYSNNQAVKNGGVIYSNNGGNITIHNGTFDNNAVTGGNGGVMTIGNADKTTITVNGGTYTKNSASGNGGAFYIVGASGTTTSINGGTFTENSAAGKGGAIHCRYTLNLKNCTIQNNKSTYNELSKQDYDIALSNSAALRLYNGAKIGVVHKEAASAKNIAIYATLKTAEMIYIPVDGTETLDGIVVTFASKVDTASVNKITVRKYNEDNSMDDTSWWIDTDGTLQQGVAKIGEVRYFTIEDAFHQVNDGETILVLKDITSDSTISLTGNKCVTLQNKAGKNVTLTRTQDMSFFTIEKGSQLNIQGTEDGMMTLDGNKDNVAATGTNAMIFNKGIFNLGENGRLMNTNGTASGQALRNNTGAEAELRGTVSYHVSENSGGAIYNYGGTLKIIGGTYEHNKGKNGGVINTGVNGNVTISGGSFKNNQATNHGGVINLNAIKLEITGGTFEGNTALANGGVINNTNASAVTVISGGEFTGNSASSLGGVIYNQKGSLTLQQNCTFQNNKATCGKIKNAVCDIALAGNQTSLVFDVEAGQNAVVYQTVAGSLTMNIKKTLAENITFIPFTREIGTQVVTSFATGVDKETSVNRIQIRSHKTDGTLQDEGYYVDVDGTLRQSSEGR